MSKKALDISDNAHRAALLSALVAEASHGAQPPRPAWASPSASAEPDTACKSTPRVWKLANDLKAMEAYTRTLHALCKDSFFLRGSPATCVEGLEWFHSYAQPAQALSLKQYQDINDYLYACARANHTTPQKACFEVHRNVCRPDRNFTQVLLEQHFPGPFKHYELDVCAYALARPGATYESWLSEFPAWREAGLYYPLALAATFMPNLSHWLPSETHDCRLACALGDCLAHMREPRNAFQQQHSLFMLCDAWRADTTGAAEVLSCTLDRLAVLMGVKSNAESQFSLGVRLDAFADAVPLSDDTHEQNFRAWHSLKSAVESAFPPSLLSAPLVKPKRDTWGFSRLTLSAQTGNPPRLRFAETSLELVKADPSLAGAAHSYSPAFIRECMAHQTSQRVQDVLWRLGEVALSQDVATCFGAPGACLLALGLDQQQPGAALGLDQQQPGAALGLDQQQSDQPVACLGARAALQAMGAPERAAEPYARLVEALRSVVPSIYTHFYPSPCSVLMWRLDVPQRAILYVGTSPQDVDPYAQSHHALPKILVNAKVPTQPVGGIVQAPLHATEDSVRHCLRSYAATGLALHPSNTILVAQLDAEGKRAPNQPVAPCTCTTLAESVACFALTRPESVSLCSLGGSSAWQEDGIDPRYAEKQLADNGFRYRDWTAVHAGKCTQQSRLACHVASFDCIHTTYIPWLGAADDGVRWVRASFSALPDGVHTLQGKSLRSAVESRFFHDPRALPTEHGEKVERSQCELYTDPSGSVAIAYCPEGSRQVLFACFDCPSAV